MKIYSASELNLNLKYAAHLLKNLGHLTHFSVNSRVNFKLSCEVLCTASKCNNSAQFVEAESYLNTCIEPVKKMVFRLELRQYKNGFDSVKNMLFLKLSRFFLVGL